MKTIKKLFTIAVLTVIALSMTACVSGHIKNEKEIIEWAKEEYNVEASVVSVESIAAREESLDDGKLYTLETKDGIQFHAKSHLYAYGLDGTDFGYSESTSGDYYKYLIESKNEQIHAIEERYHITFVKDNNGIITAIHHNDYDIEIHKEELEKIAPAISELKEIIKPTEAYASNIYVVEREYPTRRTDWYYLFAGEESLPSHTDHNGIGPYNHQDEFYAYQETFDQIVFENDFMTMDDIIKYVPYAEKNK